MLIDHIKVCTFWRSLNCSRRFSITRISSFMIMIVAFMTKTAWVPFWRMILPSFLWLVYLSCRSFWASRLSFSEITKIMNNNVSFAVFHSKWRSKRLLPNINITLWYAIKFLFISREDATIMWLIIVSWTASIIQIMCSSWTITRTMQSSISWEYISKLFYSSFLVPFRSQSR